MAKRKKEIEMVYKTTAIKMLELTKTEFEKLGLEPAKTVANPHYRSAAPSLLFVKHKIERLARSKKVANLKAKRRKPKDWNGIFEEKYSDYVSAIPAASEMLFNLNRYAKHDTCSDKHREQIYSLKNRFIELLYGKGYCERCYLHVLTLPAKPCHTCEGSGKSVENLMCRACDGTGEGFERGEHCEDCDGSGFYQEKGEDCYRCKGTGEYLPEKKLEFLVFEMAVPEKYTWHQPREFVKFNVSLTADVKDMNETEVKPLKISKSKFAEGKALLGWVLSSMKG